MNRLLFILFFFSSLLSQGQVNSTKTDALIPLKKQVEQRKSVIEQLENLNAKRFKTREGFYIVYHRNDTIFRLKKDKRLTAKKQNQIQGECVHEYFFSNGQLAYGIKRYETPQNSSGPYKSSTQYYAFHDKKIESVAEEGSIRAPTWNKTDVRKVSKLIKKAKKQINK